MTIELFEIKLHDMKVSSNLSVTKQHKVLPENYVGKVKDKKS